MAGILVMVGIVLLVAGLCGMVTSDDYGLASHTIGVVSLIVLIIGILMIAYVLAVFGNLVDGSRQNKRSSERVGWPSEEPTDDKDKQRVFWLAVDDETSYHDH